MPRVSLRWIWSARKWVARRAKSPAIINPMGQVEGDDSSSLPPSRLAGHVPYARSASKGEGQRSISIQAEEGLQQQARLHNQTEAGRKSLRERVVVEHRIARLVVSHSQESVLWEKEDLSPKAGWWDSAGGRRSKW